MLNFVKYISDLHLHTYDPYDLIWVLDFRRICNSWKDFKQPEKLIDVFRMLCYQINPPTSVGVAIRLRFGNMWQFIVLRRQIIVVTLTRLKLATIGLTKNPILWRQVHSSYCFLQKMFIASSVTLVHCLTWSSIEPG